MSSSSSLHMKNNEVIGLGSQCIYAATASCLLEESVPTVVV